jgi:flap endonuclease-1
MGIRDLNPFLKETVPEVLEEVDLNTFKGQRVGIDVSIYFYKFLYKNPRFLEGFFQQIFRLRQNGLHPVYVFDGAPPPEKIKTLNQRKERKEEMKNSLAALEKEKESINDDDKLKIINIEIAKMKKKIIYITKENINELKEMFQLLEIPYVQAEGEADDLLGKMYKEKKIDLVMSDDMDMLTSGSYRVIRNFFITSSRVNYYDLNIILNKLNLTFDQWLDFCVLCGCDYCDRIPNLGPKNAIKLIQTHGNVLNMIVNVGESYKIPEDYIDKYTNAIDLMKRECSQNLNLPKFRHPGFHQIDKVISILQTKTHLTLKQIEKRISVIYS